MDWGFEMGSVGGDAIPSLNFLVISYEGMGSNKEGKKNERGGMSCVSVSGYALA